MKRHFIQINKFGCRSMPYIVGSEIIQCESGLTYIKVCSSRNNAADLFGHKFCREKLLLPPEIIKKRIVCRKFQPVRVLLTHKRPSTDLKTDLKTQSWIQCSQESSPSKMKKGIENFKNQRQWCLVFV